MNKLYLDDCFNSFKKINNSSIDIIITSPPYNLGNSHHTGNKRHQAYNDNLPEKEYQETQIKLLNECFRVLKDDGSMIYNHKNRIKKGIQITPYEWLLKSNFVIKQELVWINRSQNFDKIRSSTGIGLDWFTPIGPLNFSVAYPITKQDTDKTEKFRFNLGTTF